VTGIELDPELPGFQRFVLRPFIGGGLDFARASCRTMQGEIVSDWRRRGDTLTWTVRIPTNTSALLHVPSEPDVSVTESGLPVAEAAGLRVVRNDGRSLVCEAGSGSFVFTSTLKNQ
jgi:alpha-L-rhamnosidase